MEDSYLHKGLRLKLVNDLRKKGIKSENVLDAINKIPRHCFMDSGFINFAYKDQAFPIAAGQTISQPFTVATQTELLDVQKRDKILEVGTGSGYQTAVLIEMGAMVCSIERYKELYLKAKSILEELGYRPQLFYGDGYLGLPTYGPFDKIIITAAAPKVPEELLEQLKPGGRLVAPIGSSGSQKMILVEKSDNDKYQFSEHGYFVFVPMLKGKE